MAMMQVYRLDGNNLDIISCPPDDLRKGDYLLVKDVVADASLIAQVINAGYANVPGVLEDLLRKAGTSELERHDFDFLQIKSFVDMIRDAKIFTCKIRRSLVRGRLSDDISWSPSRSTSRVARINGPDLLRFADIEDRLMINLGTMKDGTGVSIPLSGIDGRLNIVTGKKGTGKSYLSKLLVLGLASHGGLCLIFDVNGEYLNLGCSSSEKATINNQIQILSPGKNFKVTLSYTGIGTLLSIFSSVLDLPSNSAWEIRRIWGLLEKTKSLTLKSLGEAINSVSNRYVRDALFRRYEGLVSSRLFTDDPREATTLENWLNRIREGGAVIVNLRNLSSPLRKIVVEFMLSKLCYLLERWVIRAIFLFAEEAHLYLRGTYWEDIVTRMRHIGLFPTFVTNQPNSLSDSIYRQADNIFLFNFTNENDLATVSKATIVDVQTINTIARELPPRHCLVLGQAVNDFPLIIKVKDLKIMAMGETRFFFTKKDINQKLNDSIRLGH